MAVKFIERGSSAALDTTGPNSDFAVQQWRIVDLANTLILASSTTPNGWGVTFDGATVSASVPATLPTGGIPVNFNNRTFACTTWVAKWFVDPTHQYSGQFTIKEEYTLYLDYHDNFTNSPNNVIYRQIPTVGCSGPSSPAYTFVGGVLQVSRPMGLIVRGFQINKSISDINLITPLPTGVSFADPAPGLNGFCPGGGDSDNQLLFDVCSNAIPGYYDLLFRADPVNPEAWVNSNSQKVVRLVLFTTYPPVEVPNPPQPPFPPNAPGIPTAPGVCEGTQASLSWDAVADATSYTVYQDGVSLGSQAATSLVVAGLTLGATYAFTVTASNANGESDPSPALPVTPCAPGTDGWTRAVPGVPATWDEECGPDAPSAFTRTCAPPAVSWGRSC